LPSPVNSLESERAELDALLASEMFGRTNNPARFLIFVCNMYFAGAADGIKEYSIAVEALGRPKDFDPQTDTVVRVTAHALRKRLEDYYRTIGAQHSIHICLPAGHYVPKFVHRNDVESDRGRSEAGQAFLSHAGSAILVPQNGSFAETAGHALPISNSLPAARAEQFHEPPAHRARVVTIAAVVVIAGFLVFIAAGRRWYHQAGHAAAYDKGQAATPATAVGDTVRVLVGENRASYTDGAGSLWQTDSFCAGGTSFVVSGHTIQGTVDPMLFSAGRRGVFQCRFPVAPGAYEVRLLFAETEGLQENTRNVAFSFNGGTTATLDVVDDAAGDDIATTKVFTDIQPESDGAIHLDFTAPDSFLNAVEIVPSTAGSMLPIRIVAGHSSYHDTSGNLWLPDRYFFGGRLTRFGGDLSNVADAGIYEWQRIGHFHYVIPVAPGHAYTLKLHFREHWFGPQNGNVHGVGSRIFDVSCNGSVLLKDFDILAAAGSEPLIRVFPHIQPTAQGKIEIYFTPVVNYPSVNAIEVIPE
jgi:hypothetical protein